MDKPQSDSPESNKASGWLEQEDEARAPVLLAALEALEQSDGWKILSKILETQASYRTNSIITSPLQTLDGALEQEYVKGEAAQLLTLRGLPTVLIEELRASVRKMREDAERTDSES